MAGSLLRCCPIFGFFADNGQKTSSAALNGHYCADMEPMLDSAIMCASAGKLFEIRRSLPRPGSLALLLRR
jgi:hypothetical protein